ncbi:MAG: DUF4328 domain-containing protein [Hyphomonadaceae bacterium]
MSETYEEVGSRHQWRNPTGLWRFLAVCYLIAIAIYALLGVAEALVLLLYLGRMTIDAANAATVEHAVAILNQLIAPVFVVCATITLLLLYRLIANEHARGPSTKLTGPVLAVAAYFIPLLGFFMPPLIMAELWRASFGRDGRQPNGAITLWWTALIIGTFTAIFANYADAASWADPRNAIKLYGASIISFIARSIAAGTLLYIFGTLVGQQRATAALH